MKSRVKGDFHARFRENVGVRFPCVTRLCAFLRRYETTDRNAVDFKRVFLEGGGINVSDREKNQREIPKPIRFIKINIIGIIIVLQ